MRIVRVGKGGAVDCRAALDLPLAAISVWGQVRDFTRFARQDFFHADIRIDGHLPRVGARLDMAHRFAIFGIRRVGRILLWREGFGYSFSDLSLAGPRRGFPHIFSYRIEPLGERGSRLHICVRGRWTANRIPRWLARLWLWWVFRHVVNSVENQLLAYRLWRQGKRQP